MKLILLVLLSLTLSANQAVDFIKSQEGFKSTMYHDNGHTSIGYGTNLSYGITEAEAELLLIHRLSIANEQLKQYKWFSKLSYNRKLVILSMRYQLGLTGLLKFKDMIWCIKHNYYNGAANRMINSLWYEQSGNRAKQLVQLMRKG